MTKQILTVPDLGGAENVEVIELLVSDGEQIEVEQALFVLETDKATMEVPASVSGTLISLNIKVGDKVNEGDEIGEIEAGAAESESVASEESSTETSNDKEETQQQAQQQTKQQEEPVTASASAEPTSMTIEIPDLGGSEGVDVIEVCVKEGEEVDAEQSIIVLETDKATMEVPAGFSGKVEKLLIAVGDKVSQGDSMMVLLGTEGASDGSESKPEPQQESQPSSQQQSSQEQTKQLAKSAEAVIPSGNVYAGPAVRMLARELGVDLTRVTGTGPKGRIQKEDLNEFVKQVMKNPQAASGGGLSVPAIKLPDFSKFGEIDVQPLNKIKIATAKNLSAAWLNAPQVTQFDEADITELEAFRKQTNEANSKSGGVKFSLVPFVLKAISKALAEFPQFGASLSEDGESLIFKKYCHIGVAVDTPKGLLVPSIRDIDQKTVTEIAQSINEKASQAREGKLGLNDMQGSCISLSSLGGIGGTAFTPIVNVPEVAILGLSKSELKPKWNGKEFEPRLMLPLSLSYDHRVIDGAEAARFSQRLVGLLEDIRHLVL